TRSGIVTLADKSTRNLLHLVGARSEHDGRVQAGVRVVLDTVILPPDAQVQRQAVCYLPRAHPVERHIVVAVAAAERGWRERRRQRTCWRLDRGSGVDVMEARELALRENGRLELIQSRTRDKRVKRTRGARLG